MAGRALSLRPPGWAVGAALFLPLFALGGMGAGDVKLLAAIGAWLGPTGALWTGLYGALAGGIMAVVVALARGYASTAMRNLGMLLRTWIITGVQPVDGLTLDNDGEPETALRAAARGRRNGDVVDALRRRSPCTRARRLTDVRSAV